MFFAKIGTDFGSLFQKYEAQFMQLKFPFENLHLSYVLCAILLLVDKISIAVKKAMWPSLKQASLFEENKLYLLRKKEMKLLSEVGNAKSYHWRFARFSGVYSPLHTWNPKYKKKQ